MFGGIIFGSTVISDIFFSMTIESSGGTKRQPSNFRLVARLLDSVRIRATSNLWRRNDPECVFHALH